MNGPNDVPGMSFQGLFSSQKHSTHLLVSMSTTMLIIMHLGLLANLLFILRQLQVIHTVKFHA